VLSAHIRSVLYASFNNSLKCVCQIYLLPFGLDGFGQNSPSATSPYTDFEDRAVYTV
jgi:hypothetical protein